MKYWFGYLTAAIFGAITWVLMRFGERFSTLVDMVYPYVIRTSESILAQWASGADFPVWQLLAVALGALILASIVLMIVLKWNPIQWGGWVLAFFAGIYMLHTMLWGLNYYSGPLSDDMRLDVGSYNLEELTEATEYYRDKANALALQVNRDGITGVTFGLTGEACVNPQIPGVSLPFTMCHEMAHRMCIAPERDANFAAFLAASVHSDPEFQYSAYFMAFRYCYSALSSVNNQSAAAAAARVSAGVNDNLKFDMAAYNSFFSSRKSTAATNLADAANDTYLKVSGDESGVASYGEVCDLLVNWHIQTVVLPSITVEESPFDPYDETQVDLSGIVNAR